MNDDASLREFSRTTLSARVFFSAPSAHPEPRFAVDQIQINDRVVVNVAFGQRKSADHGIAQG